MNDYPVKNLLRPQDAAKLLYQRVFGCAHLMQSPEAAESYLCKEYQACKANHEPLYESIGNGMARLNLRAAVLKELSCESIRKAMGLTSAHTNGTTAALEKELSAFSQTVAAGLVPFSELDWTTFLNDWRSQGYPPVSHSAAFHKAFDPSYRVILQDFCVLAELVCEAERRLEAGKTPLLISIDGPCGSGKSTLAQRLSEWCGATVVHVDDFYQKPALRPQNWKEQTGGNLNLPLLRKVLTSLLNHKCIEIESWQCETDRMVPIRYSAGNIIILEGSYSHFAVQPIVGNKLTAFIRIEHAEQMRRILLRNPDRADTFRSLWIPMENRYFTNGHICENADVVLQNPPHDLPILPIALEKKRNWAYDNKG